MAMSHVIIGAGEGPARLAVRTVSFADLKGALAKGLDDFSAMPSYALVLCIIYPIAGLVLGRLAIGYDVLPLLFPLMAGFALVGPFAAIGLYEMSRRREQGLEISWRHVFDVRHRPTFGAIVTSGRVVLANPVTMAAWGFIVALLLVVGSIPLLFGLAVVMPVLGHATWHLYRRAVEPNPGPSPELQPEPPGRRCAAEFPASLFARSRDDVA